MVANKVVVTTQPAKVGESASVWTSKDGDGTFELSFGGSLPDDTLLIRGEAYNGQEEYPFVAEKLHLLLGHGAYENVNNVVERPIYLPALDVANAVTIDPLVDVTVTSAAPSTT